MPSSIQGFSLVELMVVIAIVAILATVAVPFYKNYVIKTEVSKIVANMRNAVIPVNLYIARNGVSPNSINLSTPYSAYGDYYWEGMYGLSFTFNSVLGIPPESETGYETKIYMRPHSGGTNGEVTIWRC